VIFGRVLGELRFEDIAWVVANGKVVDLAADAVDVRPFLDDPGACSSDSQSSRSTSSPWR
jgi:hypothetical protein